MTPDKLEEVHYIAVQVQQCNIIQVTMAASSLLAAHHLLCHGGQYCVLCTALLGVLAVYCALFYCIEY